MKTTTTTTTTEKTVTLQAFLQLAQAVPQMQVDLLNACTYLAIAVVKSKAIAAAKVAKHPTSENIGNSGNPQLLKILTENGVTTLDDISHEILIDVMNNQPLVTVTFAPKAYNLDDIAETVETWQAAADIARAKAFEHKAAAKISDAPEREKAAAAKAEKRLSEIEKELERLENACAACAVRLNFNDEQIVKQIFKSVNNLLYNENRECQIKDGKKWKTIPRERFDIDELTDCKELSYISDFRNADILEFLTNSKIFTADEMETVKLLAIGYTMPDIAAKIGHPVSHVLALRRNIQRKFKLFYK